VPIWPARHLHSGAKYGGTKIPSQDRLETDSSHKYLKFTDFVEYMYFWHVFESRWIETAEYLQRRRIMIVACRSVSVMTRQLRIRRTKNRFADGSACSSVVRLTESSR
jgi:hypothetical protein